MEIVQFNFYLITPVIDHAWYGQTVIVHTHSIILDSTHTSSQFRKNYRFFRTIITVTLTRCRNKTTKPKFHNPPTENHQNNQQKERDMTDTTGVDFDLSDLSVFSPENDVFILVVVSALSLLGIIHYLI